MPRGGQINESRLFQSPFLTLMPSTGGRPRKDAKKGKASKAELLESAKRRQEQLKSLEGTREGRVCLMLLHHPSRS